MKLVRQRRPRPSEGRQGPRHTVSPTAESPARGKGPSHAQHSAHHPHGASVRPAEGPRRPASPWGQHTGQSPSLETGSAHGLSAPRAEGPRGRHPPRSPCPGGCRPSASRLPCVADCPAPSSQPGSPKGPWETTRAVGGFPEACMQLAQSSGPPSLHPDWLHGPPNSHSLLTCKERGRKGGRNRGASSVTSTSWGGESGGCVPAPPGHTGSRPTASVPGSRTSWQDAVGLRNSGQLEIYGERPVMPSR